MEELREQIANIVKLSYDPIRGFLYSYEDIAGTISEYVKAHYVPKEQISKLEVIGDEKIDKEYVNAWARQNIEVDSPLKLKGEDDDEEISVLRELAQAQLQDVKDRLLEMPK